MQPHLVRFSRVGLWIMLALPAAFMLARLAQGEALAMDLFEPSGDMAVRLIVLALLPGPLTDFFGPNHLLRNWLAVRRNLGVAAFIYALLHLVLYATDLGSLAAMLDEVGLPGIWTGWLALLLLLPAAVTSSNRAIRLLGLRWKTIQRIVYPALLASFAHWLLLESSWQKAAIHGAPLIIAWTLRMTRHLQTPRRKTI